MSNKIPFTAVGKEGYCLTSSAAVGTAVPPVLLLMITPDVLLLGATKDTARSRNTHTRKTGWHKSALVRPAVGFMQAGRSNLGPSNEKGRGKGYDVIYQVLDVGAVPQAHNGICVAATEPPLDLT